MKTLQTLHCKNNAKVWPITEKGTLRNSFNFILQMTMRDKDNDALVAMLKRGITTNTFSADCKFLSK